MSRELEREAELRRHFVAGAVHDLRHPVTVIEGQRRLLVDGYLGPVTAEMADGLAVIGRQVDRLAQILSELEGAGVPASEPSSADWFDLRALLGEVSGQAQDSEPVWVLGHRSACRTMLRTLLDEVADRSVLLRRAGRDAVTITFGGPPPRLDDEHPDVLWYARVVARRHGGNVRVVTLDGDATLALSMVCGHGPRTAPGQG